MKSILLDPEMPAQELRLHMGELTADEMLVARAAIQWANTRHERGAEKPTAAHKTSSGRIENMPTVDEQYIAIDTDFGVVMTISLDSMEQAESIKAALTHKEPT